MEYSLNYRVFGRQKLCMFLTALALFVTTQAAASPFTSVVSPVGDHLSIDVVDQRDAKLTRHYELQKHQVEKLKPYLYKGAAGAEVVAALLGSFFGGTEVAAIFYGAADSAAASFIVLSITPGAAMAVGFVSSMPPDTFNPVGLYERAQNENTLVMIAKGESSSTIRFAREKDLIRFETQIAEFAGSN